MAALKRPALRIGALNGLPIGWEALCVFLGTWAAISEIECWGQFFEVAWILTEALTLCRVLLDAVLVGVGDGL